MRQVVWVALHCLLAAALQMPALAGGASLSMLPTSGPVQARVMQVGMPLEALRTAEKLQAALASQPDWAKSFLAKADPGQPLPYHPNFQVTEEEYKFFLAAATKPTLVQVGSLTLFAEKQQDGGIRLVTQPATSKVNGLLIAPDEKSVATPHATLTEVAPVNNQNAESATGRWNGTQWRYEGSSTGGLLVVKFAVGQRPDQGDSIIYYDLKAVQEGRNDLYHEVLLFPGPK